MATEKQVNYTLHLLNKHGYATDWMNASFKEFGAKMRERSGRVDDWLSSMNHARISNLIGQLKELD